MKVVMLTNVVAPDKLGGLERYVAELASAVSRLGHEVAVVSKRTASRQAAAETSVDGVQLVRYDIPPKSDPLFAAKYVRSVSRGVREGLGSLGASPGDRSAVIHGHFPVPMIPMIRQRSPYLYTFHAPVHKELLGERQETYALPRLIQGPAVFGLKALERAVLRRASHVVTLSEFTRSEMLDLTGPLSPPWTLIPGGLDTDHFSPSETARSAQSGPLLFSARRLVERTGVENLVEAMFTVLETYPSARLVVAGDGPRRQHIENLVEQRGMTESIDILGRVSESELLRWYQTADLTVTPTLELEGFGLSTAESMACGTPCLVTPVGANPEVVAALGPQFVAPCNSPLGIAEGLIRVLADRSALQRGAAASRTAIHPKMNWNSVATQYGSIYESIISQY